MSFGCAESVPEIDEALVYAYSKNVLMFAAASNCGGNDPVSWPAKHENVICVHASDGDGNPYPRTPTPLRDRTNFSILGSSVKAWWRPDENGIARQVHKSGTSTSAPVLAGVAAILIDLMRRNKLEYMNSLSQEQQRHIHYQHCLDKLGRPQGMGAVLQLMVGEPGKRGGYDYVAPWRLLRKYADTSTMIGNILTTLRDC